MDEPKVVRIAAYLRVSTSEQVVDGKGLDSQIRNIKSEVERNKDKGWVLTEDHIYSDEGISGAIRNRPALNRMLSAAIDKKIDVVLVWKIDRLYRSMSGLLSIVEELGNHNVEFKSVTENFDTSAVGKFVFQIFGVLAEFEKNLIWQRTSEGKISGALSGNYVGGGVPFGYKVVKKKIRIDQEEAVYVRMIFSWFTGLGWSVERIAAEMSKRQIVMKDGKNKMTKRTKNSTTYWHAKTVRRILQRDIYLGEYYYNRHGRDKNGKDFIKPKKDWVSFPCPAIIDQETFNKALIRFEESKKHSNHSKTMYLYSTKIVCGYCGGIFTGYTSMKKTKNYRCGKTNKTKIEHPCTASNVSELKLIRSTWDPIKNLLLSPKKELNHLEKTVNAHHMYTQLLNEKKGIDKAMQENGEARRRIKEAYRKGTTYSLEEFEEELAILDKELAELRESSEAVNAQLTIAQSKKEKIVSLQAIAKKYAKTLESIDYEGMYDIIQTLVNRVIIKDEDLQLELKVPKRYQALAKSGDEYGGPGWD